MKKIFYLLLFMVLFTANICFAGNEVHIYFNWIGDQKEDTRIILYGLPDSPVEVGFTKVTNPDDASDNNYYEADYIVNNLPNGNYTLTAKMKGSYVKVVNGVTEVIRGESVEESAPFPFVMKDIGSVINIKLSISEQ